MAEAILRKRLRQLGRHGVDVRSAGVRTLDGLSASDETVKVMKEDGIDVSAFHSRSVTADMIKRSDLILAMEPAHKEEILRLAPEAIGKTYLLKEYGNPSALNQGAAGIHDPIGGPTEEYRIIRDEIKEEIERFAGGI